jgi:release factor glutamine methyltransferase
VTLALATVRQRLDEAAARLARAGVESSRADAEWLLAGLLGVSRGRLVALPDGAIDDATAERYGAWIGRRVAREPLQYILGTQAFRDLTLRVRPDVLIPRPETETLVAWALERLPPRGSNPLVIDVGTGSGCIACAIAWERGDARVIAIDASAAAVAVARENVHALGLADRVTVQVGDLFSGLEPVRADLIVSNPPYMPADAIATLAPEVAGHEPPVALGGGPDGLDVIRRIVNEASRWLHAGGSLVLETFGGEQAAQVMLLMQEANFMNITARRDLADVTRFVAGRCPSAGFAGAIESWGEAARSEPQASDERRKGGEAPLRV